MLFLPLYWSEFLIYITFLLSEKLCRHLLQGRSTGNRFPSFLSEQVYSLPLKNNFTGYSVLGVVFVSHQFKYFTPLSSCLLARLREVRCHSYLCFAISKPLSTPLASRFIVCSLSIICQSIVLFCLSCLFSELLRSDNFGKFCHYCFEYASLPSPPGISHCATPFVVVPQFLGISHFSVFFVLEVSNDIPSSFPQLCPVYLWANQRLS